MMIVSIDRSASRAFEVSSELQRFGRRDENVGRLALESRALGLPAYRRCGSRSSGLIRRRRVSGGRLRDPGERRAQVPLDVDRERLQRRDVEHAAALRLSAAAARTSARSRHQRNAVERLAAAGRREDERRLAARDRRPAKRLRARRRRRTTGANHSRTGG